jgi:cytochrome c-type biogenesis protein CcmH/NrfF
MPERRDRVPIGVRIGIPLAVLGVALLIGSGVFSGSPQTQTQRAAAIESVVRCPQCIDVSVAQSEETTALAVRHEIVREVAQGRSSAQIEQQLVSQYGPTILLEPPDTAGFALIWIIPIVLGVGALVAVGALFWRRSRAFEATRRSQMAEDAA